MYGFRINYFQYDDAANIEIMHRHTEWKSLGRLSGDAAERTHRDLLKSLRVANASNFAKQTRKMWSMSVEVPCAFADHILIIGGVGFPIDLIKNIKYCDHNAGEWVCLSVIPYSVAGPREMIWMSASSFQKVAAFLQQFYGGFCV